MDHTTCFGRDGNAGDRTLRPPIVRGTHALMLGLVTLIVMGCANAPSRTPEPDPPGMIDLTRPLAPAPALALVLGGGVVRGFAHIGVLRALEANGLKPDLIIGSSAGGVAGAFYAAGQSAEALARRVPEADWRDVVDLDFTFFDVLRGRTRFGLLRGEALETIINREVAGKRFESFAIPFVAVAVDLQSGALVAFGRGDVGRAVRASSSMPFLFQPVRIDGRDYVDGSVVSPLPVRVARALGAQTVVAVDVGYPPEETNLANPFNLFFQTFQIMAQTLARCEAATADVVIRPELGPASSVSWANREALAIAGEKAGEAAVPHIRAALQRESPSGYQVEAARDPHCR